MPVLVSLSILVIFSSTAEARGVMVKLSCDEIREDYETKVNGLGALTEEQIEGLKSNYKDCAASGFTQPDPQSMSERLSKHFANEYKEAKEIFEERKIGSPRAILDLAAKGKIPKADIAAMKDSYEQAGKAGCENHDLRKSPKYPPVITQTRDNEWCYAYSLALALSLKLGVQVSAADIALTNMKYGDRVETNKEGGRGHRLNGGNLPKTWELLKKRGYCLESKWNSDAKADGAILDVYDKIDRGARLKSDLQKLTSCPAYGHTVESVSSLQQLNNLEDINDLDMTLEKDSALFHLADKACGKRPKIDESLNLEQLKPPNLTEKINSALRSGGALPTGNPVHAMAVVGTKWDPTTLTCRYLIRDSLTANKRTMYDPTAQAEDDHHYWVSREQFIKDTENGTHHLFQLK